MLVLLNLFELKYWIFTQHWVNLQRSYNVVMSTLLKICGGKHTCGRRVTY